MHIFQLFNLEPFPGGEEICTDLCLLKKNKSIFSLFSDPGDTIF